MLYGPTKEVTCDRIEELDPVRRFYCRPWSVLFHPPRRDRPVCSVTMAPARRHSQDADRLPRAHVGVGQNWGLEGRPIVLRCSAGSAICPRLRPSTLEMTCLALPDVCVAELVDSWEDAKLPLLKRFAPQTWPKKPVSWINTALKGYRQRVGVAQAIIHKPEILILDEPTNGLDPTQIESMRALIKEFVDACDGHLVDAHYARSRSRV